MNEDSFSPGGQDDTDNSVPSVSSGPNSDQKTEISRWVSEGMGLSEIQKKINTDFGIVMTYMDVRFLVDDLDLDLVDKEVPQPANSDSADDVTADSLDTPATGGVKLEVDGVTPPGAMASGSVTFSDGESKKWTIDQFGRLALSGGTEGYKPSDEDVMEFQKQLESSLRGPSL